MDHCCPQLSFQLAELRRKQASPTVQDLLKLDKVIRAAKVIESKIKIRSIPVEHLRFMGVHDAAHANLEGGASQQGHLILAVHASITNCRVPVSVLSWQSKKINRVVRSSLAAETCSMSTCQEHLDWMRTMREQMTRSDFVLENCEQFLTARPSILVTDCKSLYDAKHKEGAAPASTDKRLAIELAKVKAKAVSGETDLRWIDARYQIADCLTKHASRKSEAVPQKIRQEAQWRESERFVTVLPTTKNCGLQANDQMVKMGCRQEKFEECESGCAYHGITDFVTNTLMKVQHVAVSENSVHNSCVLFTVIWTWRFVLSRQT